MSAAPHARMWHQELLRACRNLTWSQRGVLGVELPGCMLAGVTAFSAGSEPGLGVRLPYSALYQRGSLGPFMACCGVPGLPAPRVADLSAESGCSAQTGDAAVGPYLAPCPCSLTYTYRPALRYACHAR